jgi:hypothetical protein
MQDRSVGALRVHPAHEGRAIQARVNLYALCGISRPREKFAFGKRCEPARSSHEAYSKRDGLGSI